MKYLVPIILPESYLRKWNWVNQNDFKTFSDENKIITIKNESEIKNYTLFRIGGLYDYDKTKEYNLLIKYSESFYSDDITKDKNKKRHLKSNWVVVKNSEIIFESPEYVGTYLNGCIVSAEYNGYYNLKTNKKYDGYYTSISTENHIILYKHKSAICINVNTGEDFEID